MLYSLITINISIGKIILRFFIYYVMQNPRNDFITKHVVKFCNIPIKKLNQTLPLNIYFKNYKIDIFKINLHLKKKKLNNMLNKNKIKCHKYCLCISLSKKYHIPVKKYFCYMYLSRKIIYSIFYEKYIQNLSQFCKVHQIICSKVAWEYFFIGFDNFTGYSHDIVHTYSLFTTFRFTRIAQAGCSFLAEISLESQLFYKDPKATRIISFKRKHREQLLRETLLFKSRDFYAYGEYQLRLLAIGIGIPWSVFDKCKFQGFFNQIASIPIISGTPQSRNFRAYGVTLIITVYDRNTLRVSGPSFVNAAIKTSGAPEFPDILLLSETLAFYKEGYNDTLAFPSLIKVITYRLWFRTILLLDIDTLVHNLYVEDKIQNNTYIKGSTRLNFVWTIDLLSKTLYDKFRRSFSILATNTRALLQTSDSIINKTAVLTDHFRSIEHTAIVTFLQLFFIISEKNVISDFAQLITNRYQNEKNAYIYQSFICIKNNTHVPFEYKISRSIRLSGILVDMYAFQQKVYLPKKKLPYTSINMNFLNNHDPISSLDKTKRGCDFLFSDRIALGFSRSFLRHMQELFHMKIKSFMLERNSITFFNKISELITHALLQNIYPNCSLQLRDFQSHATYFTINCFYNHRWFENLQSRQGTIPLIDHVQNLEDLSLHLAYPPLRYATCPNQHAILQRLELEKYYKINVLSYNRLYDKCLPPVGYGFNKVSEFSDYFNSYSSQKEETQRLGVFTDILEAEQNFLDCQSNNVTDSLNFVSIPVVDKSRGHYLEGMYALDTEIQDKKNELINLFRENRLPGTDEKFNSNIGESLHFSVTKDKTFTSHGISPINMCAYKDLGIFLSIVFYAQTLEYLTHHNTVTTNLKRLHNVFETTSLKRYRVTRPSLDNELYNSADYLRTAYDETPHYVTFLEDDDAISQIEEIEYLIDDYRWEEMLLNQSEDTDDEDETFTFSDSDSYLEDDILPNYMEADRALYTASSTEPLGIHRFLYTKNFYDTVYEPLEKSEIDLNINTNKVQTALGTEHRYNQIPYSFLYVSEENEKFETEPREIQGFFSHKYLDLLEMFSYQRWKQEYFLTKKLHSTEQSEAGEVFDYELRDTFNFTPIQISGVNRIDTLNREAFPDVYLMDDDDFDYEEEDPDDFYYHDKIRFSGLNLYDTIVLQSQTHPCLNVPIFTNLYIDQIAGLSTNLTLIINSCKKLSENVASLISFESIRSLDTEGSYFSITHLALLKTPSEHCCGVHSGISIYKDKFGSSYLYCLLYEEDYYILESIELEVTLTHLLHEIPFMVTQTFGCEIDVDFELFFSFSCIEIELEFTIEKSLDPMITTDLEIPFIVFNLTPTIEFECIIFTVSDFYDIIIFLSETETLLPGYTMLFEIFTSIIIEPFIDHFDAYDEDNDNYFTNEYLYENGYCTPPELYNEISTEEEFRLLMQKNRSPFFKQMFQKIITFVLKK